MSESKFGNFVGSALSSFANSNPISSLINIGASLGSAMFGSKAQNQTNDMNRELFDKQLAFNESQALAQRQFSLEDRAHEESYNSPAMQRQRMANAGYSPQTYDSTPVSTSTNLSSQTSAPSAPEMKSPIEAFGGMANMFAQLQSVQVQNKLIDAQINKTNEEAETIRQSRYPQLEAFNAEIEAKKVQSAYNKALIGKTEEEKRLLMLDSEEKRMANNFYLETFGTRVATARAELEEKIKQIALADTEVWKIKQDNAIAWKRIGLDKQMNDAQIELISKQVTKIDSEIKNIDADTVNKEIDKLISDCNLQVERATVDKRIEQVAEQVRSAGLANDMSEKELKWYSAKQVIGMTCDVANSTANVVGSFYGANAVSGAMRYNTDTHHAEWYSGQLGNQPTPAESGNAYRSLVPSEVFLP